MYNEKTIEKLKQKILDLAIRGKLVPQDPNDEPASILIEKIRKEKEKLIKEGKIKKPKEESFIFKGSDNLYYENVNGKVKCIQDEIPFEIPESWCWCRLKDIGSYDGGFTPNKNDLNMDKTGLPYFKVADMNTIKNQLFLSKTDVYCSKYNRFYLKNSIVFPKNGGALFTNKKRILAQNSIVDLNTGIYTLYYKGILEFVFLFFNLIDFSKIYKGSSVPTIDSNKFLKIFIPIPSLNEQIKIINKYEVIFNQINDILISSRGFSIIKNRIKSKVLNLIFNQNSSYKSYYENDFNLGDILEYEQPGPYIVKNTDYNDNFDIPVLTPGKTFILGYTDEKDGIYKATKDNKVIIFDDFTTASRLVDFNFKVKSSAMKILHISDKTKFDIDYMYYLLQTINIIVDTHKRFWISEYAPLKVRIHTYDEQIRIKNKIKSVFETIDNL